MNKNNVLNEKIFSENLLKLLLDTSFASSENPDQKYVDFFKVASPVESKFYTYCFHFLQNTKKIVEIYSE